MKIRIPNRPAASTGSHPFRRHLNSLIPLAAIWVLLTVPNALRASDHSDVPQVHGVLRQDANLTDLHAFVVGDRLVLALSGNPAIPTSATSYVFPDDVTFEINIDNDSPVSPVDPLRMGGTILEPEKIREDISIQIRFTENGLDVKVGSRRRRPSLPILNFFAGLRDDPFIRGPRQGRNIAAIVLELPLAAVNPRHTTLLIWATAKVEEVNGPSQELAGRSLRSMMPENSAMNALHPRYQFQQMGSQPDVMIYNTALPAAYPNGRALTDDVVDMVGDPRVLGNDAPFPFANDVPFLSAFPYLAPPHLLQ